MCQIIWQILFRYQKSIKQSCTFHKVPEWNHNRNTGNFFLLDIKIVRLAGCILKGYITILKS